MSGGYFLIAFPKHKGERNRSISSAAALLRIIENSPTPHSLSEKIRQRRLL
jgi:hypothetical protein